MTTRPPLPDASPAGRFWDQRYGEAGFIFGEAPNAWLAAQAPRLAGRSRALVPGDGEGRNGVWLAERGLEVTTVDASPIGVGKAQALAAQRGVAIDARVADLTTWAWPIGAYDLVVSIFLHFPADVRAEMHRRMFAALRPGGLLVLEGYAPRQLAHRAAGSVGGPQDVTMLFEPADLASDFAGLRLLHLTEDVVTLAEGPRHRGPSAVVRLLAERPA